MNYRSCIRRASLVVFLSFGALLLFAPIFLTLTTSFKTPPEITIVPPPVFPKSFLNFNNYSQVFHRLSFGKLLLNNMLLCSTVLTVTVILVPLAGYGFAKFNFLGKEIFFFMIIGVLMVPFQSVAIPLLRPLHIC